MGPLHARAPYGTQLAKLAKTPAPVFCIIMSCIILIAKKGGGSGELKREREGNDIPPVRTVRKVLANFAICD